MREYFSVGEHTCACGCGLTWTDDYLNWMNMLRHECGFPIPVNSGARCAAYDKHIGGAGVHPQQNAGDYGLSGKKAHRLLELAFKYGVTGVGVKQHGPHSKRFIHLDNTQGLTRPWVWSYPGG